MAIDYGLSRFLSNYLQKLLNSISSLPHRCDMSVSPAVRNPKDFYVLKVGNKCHLLIDLQFRAYTFVFRFADL